MTLEAIIIDVETASLFGEVIELAFAPVAPGDNGLGKIESHRFTPRERLDARAVAVHRIASVAKGLPMSDTALQCVPDARYWVGHNISYDWERLGRPRGVRLICTMQLSAMLWPKLSRRMSELYLQLFGINRVGDLDGLHSTGTDVALCERILQRIFIESGATSFYQLPFASHPLDWGRHDGI